MANSKSVEYNFLGNSGLKVSNICLGTMTFGKTSDAAGPFGIFFDNPKQLDEASSYKVMDRFVELGGNFFDIVNPYGGGFTERIIGNWLKKQNRDDIVLAVKTTRPETKFDSGSHNNFSLSRRHIIKSCEDSLSRLRTDYIDLYQAPMWDDGTPVEETLRTFDDLIRCGKIRYFGYCNLCGWMLQKIAETSIRIGLNSCVSLQQQYSLMCRNSEWEEFMVCQNEGIGVMAWSPLKSGVLAGKFKRNTVPDAQGSRTGYLADMKKQGKTIISTWDEVADDENYWKLISVMEQIAKNHDKTVAQAAIRWLLQQKVVSSVVIGVTSLQQLEDNMGAAAGWQLSDKEMTELSDICPKPNIYPYNLIWGHLQAGKNNSFKK